VAPSIKRPASETLTKTGKVQTEQMFSGLCLKADARRYALARSRACSESVFKVLKIRKLN
jgi:hypothetical protein